MHQPESINYGNQTVPPRIPLSSAQKWAEVNRLRQLAWDLKYASVQRRHPDWTDEKIRSRVREIFLYAVT